MSQSLDSQRTDNLVDFAQHIIYTTVLPLVCTAGVFAASVCVIIFTRPQMRSSLNIYLAGLSFFDLILLLVSLLIYPPMQICLQNNQQGAVCEFFWKTTLVSYPISLAAQTSSVWTCVAITVDRYLAVKYPLQTRVWCSTSRAKLVLSVIATVSFVYKLPSLFELTLDECGRLAPTPLRTNGLYIVLYNTYGYLLLLIIIPWTTMIVLNVIVIRSVQQAYRIRRSLMSRTANLDEKERHCTLMAFVMILTFIACNLMAGINHIIEAFFAEYSQFFRLRLPIANLLVCVNSASNIFIYSIFGRKFRRICAALLCPCIVNRNYKRMKALGLNELTNQLWNKLSNQTAQESFVQQRNQRSISKIGRSCKEEKFASPNSITETLIENVKCDALVKCSSE
uniref:G_PROTEIN_RECEP_F1_2 domain-containing protein n=2 Tax=Wuchereria bancrofti TaxID=6293 RepID=A0A1I8END0_WUCBA